MSVRYKKDLSSVNIFTPEQWEKVAEIAYERFAHARGSNPPVQTWVSVVHILNESRDGSRVCSSDDIVVKLGLDPQVQAQNLMAFFKRFAGEERVSYLQGVSSDPFKAIKHIWDEDKAQKIIDLCEQIYNQRVGNGVRDPKIIFDAIKNKFRGDDDVDKNLWRLINRKVDPRSFIRILESYMGEKGVKLASLAKPANTGPQQDNVFLDFRAAYGNEITDLLIGVMKTEYIEALRCNDNIEGVVEQVRAKVNGLPLIKEQKNILFRGSFEVTCTKFLPYHFTKAETAEVRKILSARRSGRLVSQASDDHADLGLG